MEAAHSYTREELEIKKYSELQKIGKGLGIKGGRLKTDKLIEAILETEVPDFLSEDAGNIATALAEAAVKEEEESIDAQSMKSMDTSDLLDDIEYPDDDLLGGLEQTPAKTPGRPTKNGLAVPTPKPQSSIKKRERSATLDNEVTPDISSYGTKTATLDNEVTPDISSYGTKRERSATLDTEVTPDISSYGTKRRRTETFEVDDEISFPNLPCQDDDEISFPKVLASENEEKVAENSQQIAFLVSQLPSLTPAQVSKRRRKRGRRPVVAVNEKSIEKSPQTTQEITNTKDIKMPSIKRESTFDKETSYLPGNQSIVREGTFTKDEEIKTLVRENTFTKDEPENRDSTEKFRKEDVERRIEAVNDDDIITSDSVSEFVANTEESHLPLLEDDFITSDSVTEFVAQLTEYENTEVALSQSENISLKTELFGKKSRSRMATPNSARKSFGSNNTPAINRKSITISRRSVGTPLNAKNVRKSIGIMGLHVSEFKKTASASTPGGAKISTPVTKTSLTRKSIGTPMAKIVTPVIKINSGRKSIGTPLAGRKSLSSKSLLGQKSISKANPAGISNGKTGIIPSKLVKPTFSIGRTMSSKTEQTNNPAGSGIPRFVSYARKMKIPDFSKIHERAFKKMEALDDYQDKKHKRTRTITSGGDKGTPKAPVVAATPVEVFTPSVTKVKNLNLNFADSAAKKKTPNNLKSPKTVKKTPTNPKIVASEKKNSASKITIGKSIKSPKAISTKSPKNARISPKVSGKYPKPSAASKAQSAKKDVPRSAIPTLKENVKPEPKKSTQLESRIPALKTKVPALNTSTSVVPSKPVNYRPYTGAIKTLHQRKTVDDLKKMANKNPNVKSSAQIRAGQRTILKGVRINKRFELQMANRGIKFD